MAGDLPSAEVLHSIDGRTRLRVSAKAGNVPFFATLADGLVRLDGVISVRTRPLTGSVVVVHEGTFAGLATRAQGENLFAVLPYPGHAESSATSRIAGAPAAGAVAMAALGTFQLFQQRVLPPAITLFWYALTLAREARAAGEAAEGGHEGEGGE
jgi:hypothetical protein